MMRPRKPIRNRGGNLAASYSRYSSDNQSSSSIDQQQRKCRDAALSNNHNMLPECEYADEAISGSRSDRVNFQRMLADAKAGKFHVLYVESLSRLAREMVMSIGTIKRLVYADGIRVISVSEGLDSDRNGWELMAAIRSWMHEEFLKGLRAAVLRGQEEAILQDYSVGDWCFGYTSEAVPGTEDGRKGRNPKPRMRVVLWKDQADIVRLVFHWFVVERRPLGWIVKELNQRKVAKDHRSTSPRWHRDQLIRLLRNTKYIGIWPWGVCTNVRDPDGRVTQEERPIEERIKFERERPGLRIVEDEVHFKAQGLLDANQDRCLTFRTGNKGRLNGSTHDLNNPRHLLQGLLRCEGCKLNFHTAGAHGQYMQCEGVKAGTCEAKTMLPRERAERLILERIGELIRNTPAWIDEVWASLQTAYTQHVRSHPDDLESFKKRIAETKMRIERLVDDIENGKGDDALSARLKLRRNELRELESAFETSRRAAPVIESAPTREWVVQRPGDLHAHLASGEPAAAIALRKLVGEVVLEEMPPVRGKRKFFRGTFEVKLGASNLIDRLQSTDSAITSVAITIDFIEDLPWSEVADEVKRRCDAGEKHLDIAAALACPRSWIKKALVLWHEERGLAAEDGRSLRGRLTPSEDQKAMIDRVGALYEQKLPMQEIAAQLGICRDSVTAYIRDYYGARGLTTPDGRTRRKTLPRSSSKPLLEE